MLKTKSERIAFFCGILIAAGACMFILFARDLSTPSFELTFENSAGEACSISTLSTSDGDGWRTVVSVPSGGRVTVKPWKHEVFKSELVLRVMCGTDSTTLAFAAPQVKAMQLHGGGAVIQKGQQGLKIDFTGSGLLSETEGDLE